ncbi:FMN-binding protein [Pseudothermotoga hypogea DSM 11164 = NBRC 106472]|uniref:FMN-binding protein n=2 Tax=Pseudothermotoga hypogea TaxID=57487 RepID=A0A0X1KQL2_9THEM|nr:MULTISPECIES: FMN-binding protein [Pseudothermotoga]AJC73562.1 FMN-binding protein [Pseudothermotoga hypogea DSM 11164 = NBRC 106472]MBC7123182.1 FMN-binding protein [Pseudothermotoga sp.]MDI6862238.1 FMN-binding protein [Pseudothermotoga sp.]
MKKESAVYTILFMVVLSLVLSSVLGFVSSFTKERIEVNLTAIRAKAILEAVGMNVDEMDLREIEKTFREKIQIDEFDGRRVYLTSVDGRRIYAFEYTGSGLWGLILAVIALDESFERLAGISFVRHSETPGLGGRIDENWFKKQFSRKKLASSYPYLTFATNVAKPGNYDPEDPTVDAITGATGTSKAVERLVNEAIKQWKPILMDRYGR